MAKMGLERIVQKGLSFVKGNKNFVIAASFMTAANLADALMTNYAINLGSEGGPVARYFTENFGMNTANVIKTSLGLGSIALLYQFKHGTKMAHAVGAGLTGFAAWNSLALYYFG